MVKRVKAEFGIIGMKQQALSHSFNYVNLDLPELHNQYIEGPWPHNIKYLRQANGTKQYEHYEYIYSSFGGTSILRTDDQLLLPFQIYD